MTIRMALLGSAAIVAGYAAPALAQADPTPQPKAQVLGDDSDIVVTGSRIRRQDLAGVGPATVVTAEQIQNTGIVNIETALQRLPANAGFAGNQTSAYWTNNGYGTAQVNLRGLGIKRTLVLLNGRRLVAGGTGANSSPDLNMIPVVALARTDVLKDGASAIYGADAMAGVVNLVTRTDYEGLGLSVRQGITERGDGSDLTADLLWGIRNDRGGFMAAVTYQKTSAVNMASRAPCSLAETTPGSLSCVNSASTIGGRAVLPNGQQINFNQVPGGNGNFYEPYSPAKHNFNSNPFLNAVSPVERVSTAFFADYALTDGIQAFGEFLYTFRKSNQIATPGTLRNLSIPASNPTNPTGQNLVLAQRRLAEPGARHFFQETDTWQGTFGLRGKLANDWAWEVAGSFGRNTAVDGSTNIANLERVANTLDRSKCSSTAGAAIPCGDYLGFGDLTPQVLDYILFTSRDRGGNELGTVTADLNGDLFSLPAGAVSFATGVVYRREKGWRDPDPLTVLGVANVNQQDPISGSSTAKEAYLELSVPVLANTAFAKALTLDGAVRYSDYNLFGSDWNYKLSADWVVNDSIRLRGTYGTGFRIPNVPELFGGVSEGNLTTTDPCSRYTSSGNVTLIANCQASGVPANYTQLGTTILTTVGGNQSLRPESSTTWTVGTVISPRGIIPGLSLTADWFDIKIKDAIRAIPGSTKLAVCYASQNLSHPFCSDFTRSALTGEVTYLSAQPINTGREEMNGLDLGLVYSGAVGEVKISLDLNMTYLNKYVVNPFPGGAPIYFDGFIGGGNGGYPKWRGYGVLTAEKDGISATWSTQWIGKATDFNASAGDIGYRTPNVFYHNLQLAFAIDEKTRFQIGADNLFDRKAPYIQSFTDANTDTMTYDLLGRRFYAGFRTAF
ncbi:TonB-dependent receptor [Sphingomonas koreensis]|jgi:outer membrane receptor protein involved in Fe transport|uniref:TonB-dependent receptor n=19 Tax=Pseudomonadota TaxID=1224 RepID=A0A1L6JHS9_9SPHN|nr:MULTISPECIES: TonB-dependent receptor [Sphingomonadaceae]ARR57410.1 TonB-dependent receptor [Rhizorhabdus wittichii DC-6]EPR11192.1 TonB-dependent receptor [Sphingobium indicum IP26]MBU0869000.1 TonB-dependent receptor [Alphaproteobacteria bacterium]MCZ4343663.1 TonB-dependent receptor [Sphingomonadaceae bacterium G21617-S1]AGH51600.1 TonB-dependent receptor [Sphingomonas sp. MM-1]|tara:strand:- start:4956 stop:7658 length:2703 start_codon:yes stop_codon:yes gene_type:complete